MAHFRPRRNNLAYFQSLPAYPAAEPCLKDGEVVFALDTEEWLVYISGTLYHLAYLLNPMTTLGDLIYGGASGAAMRLAGDTSNTRKFLRELSSAGVAAAPVWDTLLVGDLPALNGLAAADVALTDAVVVNKAGTNNTETVQRLGGFVNPGLWCGRVTTVQGSPLVMTDQTSVQRLWLDPDPRLGNRGCVFDGTRWLEEVISEVSIRLTDSTQTGTWSAAARTITGLTDTSQLVRGMQVTGLNLAGGSTIASVDSATQVTLNVNPSGSSGGAAAVTFQLPANTAYYLYAIDNAGTPKLQFGAAGLDTLGTQDGVQVNNAAIASGDSNSIAAKKGRVVAIVSTTASPGNTEDSAANRLVANYHPAVRTWKKAESTDSTNRTSTSTSFAQVGSCQFTFVSFGDYQVRSEGLGLGQSTGGASAMSLGIGSATNALATGAIATNAGAAAVSSLVTTLAETPAPGLVTRYLIFRTFNAGTANIYGGNVDPPNTVLRAMIQC